MTRSPSTAAERMREYRRRRRYGVLSIRVRVACVLIDALIKRRSSSQRTAVIATKSRSR